MGRLNRGAVLVVFALSIAGFSAAQTAAPATPVRRPFLRHRLRECLSILDLTDQERSDVQAALDAARPTLDAAVAAVQAARQTLETALGATPPDACAIGADALALEAARQTLRTGREAVLNQVLAILRPDQQARFLGCVDAPWLDPATPAAAAGDEPGEP